uniref:Uncharacterized protein n=1 Tax=Rhizophora mucronata TaxID=61149 RepID=A0A2P2MXK8_RHIMU
MTIRKPRDENHETPQTFMNICFIKQRQCYVGVTKS